MKGWQLGLIISLGCYGLAALVSLIPKTLAVSLGIIGTIYIIDATYMFLKNKE